MLIYFLRHGEASSDSRFDDHERPLTNEGVRQATIVTTFFQRMHIHVDAIVASPLKRTQQTATIIQEGLHLPPLKTSDLLLNGKDFHQLLEYLNTLQMNSLLLVGHIPHLSDMLSLLIYGKTDHEIKMGKCSLAVVESPHPIRPESGTLKQLTHIEALTKLVQS
jgi:phosphohistidine phosphatase